MTLERGGNSQYASKPPRRLQKDIGYQVRETATPKEKVATNQLHSNMDEDHTCVVVEHTVRAPVSFA